MESASKQKVSGATGECAPRYRPADNNAPAEEKKLFFRLAEGGKRVEVPANLCRIIPRQGKDGMSFYTEVQYLVGGVWKQAFTTPFAFEIARLQGAF